MLFQVFWQFIEHYFVLLIPHSLDSVRIAIFTVLYHEYFFILFRLFARNGVLRLNYYKMIFNRSCKICFSAIAFIRIWCLFRLLIEGVKKQTTITRTFVGPCAHAIYFWNSRKLFRVIVSFHGNFLQALKLILSKLSCAFFSLKSIIRSIDIC